MMTYSTGARAKLNKVTPRKILQLLLTEKFTSLSRPTNNHLLSTNLCLKMTKPKKKIVSMFFYIGFKNEVIERYVNSLVFKCLRSNIIKI